MRKKCSECINLIIVYFNIVFLKINLDTSIYNNLFFILVTFYWLSWEYVLQKKSGISYKKLFITKNIYNVSNAGS